MCHQKATGFFIFQIYGDRKAKAVYLSQQISRSEHRGSDTNLSEKGDLIPVSVCVSVRVCVLVQSEKYHRAVPHTYAGGNG